MTKMIKKNSQNKKQGFTLIELLIVIAVMAILTTVVFVALNPLARFQDARNNRRWTDVEAILSGLKLDQVDNGGAYVASVSALSVGAYYMIGTGTGCNLTCANPTVTLETVCVDISAIVTEGYLPAVPFDPFEASASSEHTFYYLLKNSNGSIEIGSCSEEAGSGAAMPTILVKR